MEGTDGQYKIATLDPDPDLLNEVTVSLGCIQRLPVAYLTPSVTQVPPWVDTYVLGMWDDREKDWLDEHYHRYYDPTITLDGAAIYIHNRIQVSQLLELLEYASRNQSSRYAFNTGMYDLDNDNQTGLWGEYDVSGLENALEYLDCYAAVR